mmetsp:Transcript_42950/g.124175  ORF Transcript_42950/g.124175 Transcript_42950/m.124175 type:complete len:106 (-) Transcript_42950:631-948(-)
MVVVNVVAVVVTVVVVSVLVDVVADEVVVVVVVVVVVAVAGLVFTWKFVIVNHALAMLHHCLPPQADSSSQWVSPLQRVDTKTRPPSKAELVAWIAWSGTPPGFG